MESIHFIGFVRIAGRKEYTVFYMAFYPAFIWLNLIAPNKHIKILGINLVIFPLKLKTRQPDCS